MQTGYLGKAVAVLVLHVPKKLYGKLPETRHGQATGTTATF